MADEYQSDLARRSVKPRHEKSGLENLNPFTHGHVTWQAGYPRHVARACVLDTRVKSQNVTFV